MTTVRPLSNVSVISISSSIELGFIVNFHVWCYLLSGWFWYWCNLGCRCNRLLLWCCITPCAFYSFLFNSLFFSTERISWKLFFFLIIEVIILVIELLIVLKFKLILSRILSMKLISIFLFYFYFVYSIWKVSVSIAVVALSKYSGTDTYHCCALFYCYCVISCHTHGQNIHTDIIYVFLCYVNW